MTREPKMRKAPEFELITEIRRRLGAAPGPRFPIGSGDDAAVVVPDGGVTATTIDALVDGVHFRTAWCTPAQIGHKALAVALSDLAAMGAAPGEAYVWLGRPPTLSDADCLEICDGIARLSRAERVAVLGGDLTRSPVLSLAVSAVGYAPDAEALVSRDGAREGDVICVTGAIGAAAAGLMLLEHPELADSIGAADASQARDGLLAPLPRLRAGSLLAGAGATAMIDISDGLGAEAEHLAAASSVGIEIEMSSVPLARCVGSIAAAAGRDPYELAGGGEDYELLCAIPRSAFQAAVAALDGIGVGLSEIGRVVGGSGVRLRLPGGRSLPVLGHDHLAG